MPKVTNLKKTNKQFEVSFLLENGSEKNFVCSENLVVSYRLVLGKELDPERFKTFVIDHNLDGLIEKTIRYAALSLRSESEIDNYLSLRGASQSDAESIKAKLRQIGLIDDHGFSTSLVESLFYGKRYGKEKIIFLLEQRGFPSGDLKSAVAKIPKEDVTDNLEILFQKKLSSLKSGSARSAGDKMKRYLLARGYGVAHVIAFVDSHRAAFQNSIDEETEIVKDYLKLEKRLRRTTDSEQTITDKIIRGLLAKGYQYPLIKKVIERRR